MHCTVLVQVDPDSSYTSGMHLRYSVIRSGVRIDDRNAFRVSQAQLGQESKQRNAVIAIAEAMCRTECDEPVFLFKI